MKVRIFVTLFFVIVGLVFATGSTVLAKNADIDKDIEVIDQDISAETAEIEPAALVIGTGRAYLAKFLSETNQLTNSNYNVWVNAFYTTVSLTSTGCISLRYSGEALATGALPYNFQFRALIGGVVANNPYVFFDPTHANYWDFASFNWWRCGLSAGTYSVYVQFKPYSAGDTAGVRQRTLIIEY